MLCHCGSKIYRLADTATVLFSGAAEGRSCGFYAIDGNEGRFYILTSGQYLVFDGTRVTDAAQSAYIPLVAIAKSPSGAGVSYEDINLISPKRKEAFTGTEDALVYQLGAAGITQVDVVEVMTAEGSSKSLVQGTDYTVNKTLGQITFVKPQPTPLTGHDNITVTYTKPVAGYAENITGCTVSTMYGCGGENRVFVSGNPQKPHTDWWSQVYNPTYFPDLSYAVIGGGQTAVMGYVKLGSGLGIVKQANGQDPTLFIRSAHTDGDGRAVFTVKNGVSGAGAVCKNSFALANDEPLFLSQTGVTALVTSNVTSQQSSANRSYQLDGRLLAEKHLADAVCCVWGRFYLLAVDGKVYLLDTGRTVRNPQGTGYEGYFWDNVPAVALATDDDRLWFGTADGRVCCFKDTDNCAECYTDDGRPIHAVWKTSVEDEGRIDRFKTISRKGCVATFTPYDASSCRVSYSVDGRLPEVVQDRYLGRTPMFGRVDFARVDFFSGINPREIYFYSRRKRYKRIQLVFENNVAGEGFGIQKITKRYRLERYSKNRR